MQMQAKRFLLFLLSIFLLISGLSACSNATARVQATTSPTTPGLTEGGPCVQPRVQPPYTNVQVSHDIFLAHSEPMLVEDPQNPLHLIGGSKFFTDPTHYRFQIGYFSSFDGGCTWKDGGVLPGFTKSSLTSDISFAFGPQGETYAAVLYESGSESGIAISKSTDGGKTFAPPTKVFATQGDQIFNDKPWIAVDQTQGPHRGNIYVVWSYDHGGLCAHGVNFCQTELAFSRSMDAGQTFSPLQLIEGNAPFCTNPATGRAPNSTTCDGAQGAIPVVEPDGTLAVAFPYIDVMEGPNPTRLLLTTSRDGGLTWTTPVLIATIHDILGTFPPDRYRNLSLPAFAGDPKSGQLYLTWSDKGPRDADILFVTSRDQGKTWSNPLRVNDDSLQNGANQFQPQMVVAPNGVISISFFDTRLDPQHRLIDVYLAQSNDHGISFLKNVRVTTQSWDPSVDAPIDEYGQQFIGDYQGLAADNLFVHPFWNDTRTGRQEIFTAAISGAQPHAG
ncbi:MAG TPA: sialidase family protein [Ktedonosporobacter sp.]|nr:sialidase family protein [Ktedonosporobacter sp.]